MRLTPDLMTGLGLLYGDDLQKAAAALGMDLASLERELSGAQDLLDAWVDGAQHADGKTLSALYRRATGIEVTETRITPRGEEVSIRQYPPDVQAIKLLMEYRGLLQPATEESDDPADEDVDALLDKLRGELFDATAG